MVYDKFISWYKANMASKRELEKFAQVELELQAAFHQASGNPYTMRVVDIFWDNYNRGEINRK